MKKTFSFFLVAFFAAVRLCAVEIEAPTQPQWVAPSDSLECYLYNVEADAWMTTTANNSSYLGVNTRGRAVLVKANNDGSWSFQFADEHYYWYRSGTQYLIRSSYNYVINGCRFAISSDEGVYHIQNHSKNTSYYDANQWWGWVGETSDYVYANRALGENTSWKFATRNAAERYYAERALYDALKSAEAYAQKGHNIAFFTDYYYDLYNNRASKTPTELEEAATKLTRSLAWSGGYIYQYWNDYPMMWTITDGTYGQSNSYTWALGSSNYKTGTYFERGCRTPSTISATVNVDQLSTLVYSLYGDDAKNLMQVFIDGKQVRYLFGDQFKTNTNYRIYSRFCEVLQPGTHTIKWVFTPNNNATNIPTCRLIDVGVMKSPLITVDLLEPGSLGTEVLYNTDHVKNVRRLKVKGEMNSDDFAKLKMMSTLTELDLSEAKFKEIPEGQFKVGDDPDTTMCFLHSLKLPEGLERINEDAFYGSFIDTLAIPSTVTTVGYDAFYRSHIKELNLPDNLTNFVPSKSYPYYACSFRDMKWLEKATLPKNLTTIPDYSFYSCTALVDVVMPEKLQVIEYNAFCDCDNLRTQFPEGLKTIGSYAFYGCYKNLDPKLPNSLETIGSSAFRNCNAIDSLFIPQNVTSIGSCAFECCYGLKYAEVSTPNYYLDSKVFSGCKKLQTLRLNSPTVVTVSTNADYYPVDASQLKSVDLIVPNFIVNNYKLDQYWYNFKSITGFDSEEIQDWSINNPVVLNHERMEGNPNITIQGNVTRLPSLKINGTNAQQINNLSFGCWRQDYYYIYPGQLLSNCSKVTVNGKVSVALGSYEKYWYFYSLPFDVKISDIECSNNTQYAIRFYDGAGRAQNGKTGNWKNFDKENDTIPAGTGFIMQTNNTSWNYFYAMNNAMKQNVVSNKEFVKTLNFYDSENSSNKGWNLVGNPYQCYYNTHCLNFTAPITVWNVKDKTYTAYSLTDDDYALRPNEAFFVQCPNAELTTISFPTQGRQLNAVVESQNAVKAMVSDAPVRKLINVVLTDGEQKDQTRVVLNEKASLDYEMTCDASKFMSMESGVSQLFSLDAEGTQYAINERPVENGTVQLGFMAAKGGSYTFQLDRCDLSHVYLTDLLTSETTELTAGTYTFTTDAGTFNSRFYLSFDANELTGITQVELEESVKDGQYYTVDGKFAGSSAKALKKGIYVVRKGNKSHKVIIR